eukprot:2195689-Lingulodinium_polyedra.AAC.1
MMRSNRPSAAAKGECVRVLFARRCGGRPSIRPHHCARFPKPCIIVWSSRPSAATAARKSHARALHADAWLRG